MVDKLLVYRVSKGVKAGDVFRKGANLYKVRWQGFGEDEDSWEPKSKIAAELVAAFHTDDMELEPASPKGEKRERAPAASPSAQSPDGKR